MKETYYDIFVRYRNSKQYHKFCQRESYGDAVTKAKELTKEFHKAKVVKVFKDVVGIYS